MNMVGSTPRIGVNWTVAEHLPLVRQYFDEGLCDYIEILIDNFLQASPDAMARALEGVPVAFHIMHSEFLERDRDGLAYIAERVRAFVDTLRPMYVSDHLLRFSIGGRRTVFLPELDYDDAYHHVRASVLRWQELLGRRVYFENYPSVLDTGRAQPAFLKALLDETGAGLLFDISNAVVALENCDLPLSAWQELAQGTERFHIAGYGRSQTSGRVVLDLHASPISEASAAFAREILKGRSDAEVSLTVERDRNLDYESWAQDLTLARSFHG